MTALAEFKEILTAGPSLAALTGLGVGGPADWIARPRGPAELERLLAACEAERLPWRLLGGGSNILAPDEGVRGVVIQLTDPSFRRLAVEGCLVRAGVGAELADLLAFACKASLSGLEVLAGIPGTVGGALRGNAGTRGGDIGQFVHSVDVLDEAGRSTRGRNDIRFGFRQSNLDDVILLEAVFELVADRAEDIVRRLKKVWIIKKAQQPFGFQRTACVFRNPRGLNAADLIDKAAMRGAKVGEAELSDRDPCYVVVHEGATSRDVRRLIELVRSTVQERSGVALEVHIDVW